MKRHCSDSTKLDQATARTPEHMKILLKHMSTGKIWESTGNYIKQQNMYKEFYDIYMFYISFLWEIIETV